MELYLAGMIEHQSLGRAAHGLSGPGLTGLEAAYPVVCSPNVFFVQPEYCVRDAAPRRVRVPAISLQDTPYSALFSQVFPSQYLHSEEHLRARSVRQLEFSVHLRKRERTAMASMSGSPLATQVIVQYLGDLACKCEVLTDIGISSAALVGEGCE